MLTVPLQARHFDDGEKQLIEVWVGGERIVKPAPIRPYLYSRRPLVLHCNCRPACFRCCVEYDVEKTTVTPLDTLEPITAWKYTFPTVRDILNINKKTKKMAESVFLHENHIPFLERISVDCPEFWHQFKEPLNSQLTFDIETLSKKGRYYDDVIAISMNDGNETWSHVGSERQILEGFVSDWKKMDPDIIIGYNIKGFDIPKVIARCRALNIPTTWVNRDQSKLTNWSMQNPMESPNFDEQMRAHRMVGRVYYDVWESAVDDQVLRRNVKDFRLKTVAPYFGKAAIQEETSNTQTLLADIPRLIAYCESDVNAARFLYEKYLFSQLDMANYLPIPFDEITNTRGSKRFKRKLWDQRGRGGYSTLVTRILMARGMMKRGFIEAGPNHHRFPSTSFQAAYVDSFQTGVFHDILHIDVQSLYPSAITSLNISPETTKLIKTMDYDPSQPFIWGTKGDKMLFCVADSKYDGGKNLIIEVNTTFEGSLNEFVVETKIDRAKSRAEMVKHIVDSSEYTVHYSAQWAKKIRMNACGFGTMTPASERYASLICGILITAFGRYLMKHIIVPFVRSRLLKPIELDTDGIFLEWGTPTDPAEFVAAINEHIRKWMEPWAYKLDIKMESTMYRDALFRKKLGGEDGKKTYVLRGKWLNDDEERDIHRFIDGVVQYDDKTSYTGSALVNRTNSLMVDGFRDILVKLILDGASDGTINEAIRGAMNLKQYSIADMSKTVSLNKPTGAYKVESESKTVALFFQEHYGIPADPGNSYRIVYGKKQKYIPAEFATMEQIDTMKYRGYLVDMAQKLGFKKAAALLRERPKLVEVKQAAW